MMIEMLDPDEDPNNDPKPEISDTDATLKDDLEKIRDKINVKIDLNEAELAEKLKLALGDFIRYLEAIVKKKLPKPPDEEPKDKPDA